MSDARKTLEEREQMSELERLRHSCAHVMATAILRIWPDAQFADGPPVENGFYYDFELEHRITPEDFPRIEEEMEQDGEGQPAVRAGAVTRDEALDLARARPAGAAGRAAGQPEQVQAGPARRHSRRARKSRCSRTASSSTCAPGRTSATRELQERQADVDCQRVLQGRRDEAAAAAPLRHRIPERKEELEDHLARLEEAQKRDHRKLGRELGLFHIDEAVGQGLILWKPKGALVRRALQDFITEELDRQGYDQVFTPHIGKLDLYRTSGHFPYYAETQYPPLIERDSLKALADEGCSCADLANRLAEGDVDGFLLKPMNCPHHIKIFDSEPHCYRDLPVRLAEFGTVYRWEQSGELGGMTRVRGFTQDDAHLFCTPDQVAGGSPRLPRTWSRTSSARSA